MAIWVEPYIRAGTPTGSDSGHRARQRGLWRGADTDELHPVRRPWPIGSLAVEVNHAGTGQKDEAITIAKAILAKLGG